MEAGKNPRPKAAGTKQLFDNPILEKLSRTHISVPLTLYSITSTVMGWYAFAHTELDSLLIGLLFLAGIVSFTFVEYWMHRSVYHMATDKPWKEKFQYTMHGVHHEFPKDKTRLALPPVLAVIIAVVLFSLFFVLMSEAAYAFFPGFLVGYTGYLTIHFCVHAYAPPKNVFKQLWINHSVHHYRDGQAVFGVSSPLWDHIFGTMATMDKSKVDKYL
jgi:sterol desaturase/sphingolipid hydroxylase (fatty acid hydroxylase superfamily)